ncbi:MAG: hypothetical protein HY509_04630 [Acidobacteria bacterium]|nr:hypothetical protein [Acidobacteriota bacterium]
MAALTTEAILDALKRRIEKTKQTLKQTDPSGDREKYRAARKRLKRAQRRLQTWKELAARLEKRKEKKGKKGAAPAEPAPEMKEPGQSTPAG